MKFIYLLGLILLSSCFENKRDCAYFKTGEFYSVVTINGRDYKSEFTRSNDLQVEKYADKIDSTKLRWILKIPIINQILPHVFVIT